MHNNLAGYALAMLVGVSIASVSDGAEYRIMPSSADVLAGSTVGLAVEVETEPGDNLIGVGHYSFAIDLALGGTAGATGGDISNVVINTAFFDDYTNGGASNGLAYLGTAGSTTDVTVPNFGSNVGDVLWLSNFDLTVPASALVGDTILITPSEGFLENVTVTGDLVYPQHFAAATLTVVPEPTTLLALAGVVGLLRRR